MSDLKTIRWQTDGKFFRSGSRRIWIQAVTYGPFPGGWPDDLHADFSKMAASGINAIRLYSMPDDRLLDSAGEHGLKVFAGLEWGHSADFFQAPRLLTAAEISLQEYLRKWGTHAALAGMYVGNEVPADLARWMGPVKVKEALEALIRVGREVAPGLLFAYANYPSTEYLEPENADFTAMNVYLEEPESFRKYLKRLHHVAGDRPVVISEFGLDSRRNGEENQAKAISWAQALCHQEEVAGITVFSWSDRWTNGGEEVLDWDFGLLDRQNHPKQALSSLHPVEVPADNSTRSYSVIVCTRNGRTRIAACLEAIQRMDQRNLETIVVDDGSTDGTAEFVAARFPWVRLLRLPPGGLSLARNSGASIAEGDILAFTDDDCEPDIQWIKRLGRIFDHGYAAVGGPNLAPVAKTWEEAVVSAAPGAPSHVMLDDEEAEHLPGCNLAVTKNAFWKIGGFDPIFHTAGDDVDFCWRLREAGYRLGFAPGAFVWHWRRPSVWTFLRQQIGYGHAEKLLMQKHPHRFSKNGSAKWEGFIYGGGPVRAMDGSVIYHGPMGQAGYQSVTHRMLPLRGLNARFDQWKVRMALKLVVFCQPRVRAWARNRHFISGSHPHPVKEDCRCEDFAIGSHGSPVREDFLQALLADGWQPGSGTDEWDLEKNGTRVLLATEHGRGKGKRTLVRVWGDRSLVEPLLRSLPGTFK